MTQQSAILEHLQQGNRLTALEALELFNCLSCSQRVGELKREGWPIVSKMITTPTGKKIAEYSLQWPMPAGL